jgi:membrane protein involved in colicin uptake
VDLVGADGADGARCTTRALRRRLTRVQNEIAGRAAAAAAAACAMPGDGGCADAGAEAGAARAEAEAAARRQALVDLVDDMLSDLVAAERLRRGGGGGGGEGGGGGAFDVEAAIAEYVSRRGCVDGGLSCPRLACCPSLCVAAWGGQ